jgi:hypothetical protein
VHVLATWSAASANGSGWHPLILSCNAGGGLTEVRSLRGALRGRLLASAGSLLHVGIVDARLCYSRASGTVPHGRWGKVETQAAVSFINGMAFKQDWKPYATYWMPGAVLAGFTIKTVDTSYPDADGVCRAVPLTLRPAQVIRVRDLDETGLAYAMIRIAAEASQHEDREFLKVQKPDGSWVAPLHPHTLEGELAWSACERQEALAA